MACFTAAYCLTKEKFRMVSSAEQTFEFIEFLLHYLIKTLLPYEGLPLEDGYKLLPEKTWFTMSECILLISLIQDESDASIQSGIARTALHLPQSCRAIHLAFHIGFGNEGGMATSLFSLSIVYYSCIVLFRATHFSHEGSTF